MASTMVMAPPEARFVGKVTATVKLTNWDDERAASRGELAADAVRSIEFPDVLVDTGATNLCLPARFVSRLGLVPYKVVEVGTASGVREMRVMGMVEVRVGDRSDVFSCLEISDEAEPLLGLIPLEALGLNPNVHTRQLDFLPMDKHQSYITA